ncbi:MAG: Secretion system C-terminal sorting domain [Bacteroidota bacterium]|nr:Secretion system C-terminal sorting domain [Bacteroidota bacterium]
MGGSVSEIDINRNIKVYPNPAYSAVTVEIKEWNNTPLEYSIYNMLSEKISAGLLESPITNIGLISSGLHYIVIHDGNLQIIRKIINIKE